MKNEESGMVALLRTKNKITYSKSRVKYILHSTFFILHFIMKFFIKV